MRKGLASFLFLAVPLIALIAQKHSSTYELRGGWWFDGTGFVRTTVYVADGVFLQARPARVDSVLDLGNLYVVPPFGDAHTHAFDTPESIRQTVASNLREGIFYALSLANSAAGKRAVAAEVNRPTSMDVAYADAALTSTLGHPIMSAEMAANHWRWDSLRTYYPLLLKSRKAEGDAYFVLDSFPDLERQWDRILSSRPDVIKIIVQDSERHDLLRRDTTSLGNRGLDPAIVPAIVARAHRDGLRVAAHIETAADFHVAIAAGADIIAHLPGLQPRSEADMARYVISDNDAILAARQGAVVIPTAWLAEQSRMAGGDTAQVARARRLQRDNIRLLMRHGVRLAIGSDLFVNASTEAAYLLGLGVIDTRTLLKIWSETTPKTIFPHRRIGQLTPGNEASFIALSCDPIADFTCTAKISLRMKQGWLLHDPGTGASGGSHLTDG